MFSRTSWIWPLVLALVACQPRPPDAARSSLDLAFDQAGQDYAVPPDLLRAISYAESRWDMQPRKASLDQGYGLMHLQAGRNLERAAQLTGYSVDQLESDPVANVRGGAAVLSEIGDRQFGEYASLDRHALGDWWQAVMHWSALDDARQAESYAQEIFHTLERGAVRTLPDGEVRLPAQKADYEKHRIYNTQTSALVDYPGVNGAAPIWVASPNHYTGRTQAITTVVVHDMEGTYAGTVGYFSHSSSQVSSHYLVRSSDGEITHMVADTDAAWHVQCYNQFTIGIEHEGYAAQGAQWYTEAMYQASAALVRWECDQHSIPKDRTHVIAHSEVPASCNSGGHTDPGPAWDWTHYMALVTGGTTAPVQGHLVGVVYSGSTANRVAAAHVALSGGPTVISGVADASGYYTFDVDPGTYTVTATATGYQSNTATGAVTSGQTTWASVNLTAAAAQVGSYFGKVYIAGDLTTCVDGAIATLTDSYGAVVTAVASNPYTVHASDPQCLFRFSSVPVGTYTVKASAAGYTDGTSTQTVTAGQISYGSIGLSPGQATVHTAPTLTLTSPPENAVSLVNPIAFEGTVTTTEGVVSDVEISVNGGPAQQVPLTAGAFASPVGIVSGLNTVVVTASNGFLTATATRHLTFRAGADLIVVDRDHAAAPLSGATVQLLAEGGAVQTQGTTAADGRVALDAPPGAYQLHVEHAGFQSEDERVTLPGNARLAVTVPLSSGIVAPQPVSLYIDEPATGTHAASSPVAVRGHLTGTAGNVDTVVVNHLAATVKQDDGVGNLPDGGSTDWSASFELAAMPLVNGSNHIVVVASLVDGGSVTAVSEVGFGTSGSSGSSSGSSGGSSSGAGSSGGSTGTTPTKSATGSGCASGSGLDVLAILAVLGLRRRR